MTTRQASVAAERSRAMVRVSADAYRTLRELSNETGESMQVIVSQSIQAYWRQCIIDGTVATYAALRADPVAWQELLEEDAEWEATLADGLDDE